MGDPLLEINVLGVIAACRDGKTMELGGRRQRRLLAALACDCGRTVTIDRLAERVWPDGLPDDPGRALRTGIARLRRALGGGAIATDGRGYQLVAAEVSLDSDRFTEAVEATAAPERPSPTETVAALDLALALWRGDAYADLADDAWAQPEIERLNELRAVAVERRFDAMLDSGRHTDSIGPLAAAVEEYPLRDRLVGLHMLALYRCGRQAEAARVFQDHRRRLADDLGLEPGPELVALDRQVLMRDPALDDHHRGGRAHGQPHAHAQPEGQALRSYQLGAQLGEGAFAVVFRGSQPSVGREVAVKVIRAELANRPEFVRRFEAEAQLVARLEHPHIVPLYDYWREPGRACLVFRYLRGGTLESRLAAGGLPLPTCHRLVLEIGSALAVAHQAGVVHRDVKPANVFCDEQGHFYLGDFGIALDATERNDPTAALSAGSPAYASPEQLRREPVGPPADVHGLAISVYEALTGRLPFPDATTNAELLQRQLHDPIPSIRVWRSDIPQPLDAVLAKATAKAPTDRYQRVEDFVEAFERAIAGPAIGTGSVGRALRGAVTSVAQGEDRNPYKGLRPFSEADAPDFCGRARLVDRFVAHLSRPDTAGRALVVVGPSGIGKSSVVRAGLIPALRRGAVAGSDQWFVLTMQPGHEPFEELASALLRVATTVPSQLMATLTEDHRGLARVVKAMVPDGAEFLLVIDQFEELFTLTTDEVARRRFLDALEAAVTDSRCPLRLVVTLRADFYDRPLRHGSFARLIEPATIAVTALAPDELEAAIVEPASAAGIEFEPGLVSEIVADVGDQPGALPLLQYALTELYDRRISGLLTRASYHQLGGVAGALAARAEGLLAEQAGLAPAARRLFGRLVRLGEGTEDTRRRAPRSELGNDPDTAEVIARFGDARLLSFDRDPATREPTVDVAHEQLLRSWPRLREWLDADRDDLRSLRHLHDAAAGWEASGRDPAELYRGARLESALDWRSRHREDATALEANFVAASEAHRDAGVARERRRLRRLRALLAAVAAVAAVALVAGSFALVQRRRADRNARSAEANAELAGASALAADAARVDADVGRLASEAAARAQTDRQVALLLATEAFRREQSPRTYGALQRVLSATGPFLGAFGNGRHLSGAAWVDEHTVVAFGPSGVGRYDLTTGRERSWTDVEIADYRLNFADGQHVNLPLAAGGVGAGAVVVVGRDKRTARIVGDDRVTDLFVHPVAVAAVAVAPGGQRAATLDLDGTARVFDLGGSGRLVSQWSAHPERRFAEQLPDGVRFYSNRAPQTLTSLPTTQLTEGALDFASDTQLLSLQGISARLWDPTSGQRVVDGVTTVMMAGVLAAPVAARAKLGADGQTFTWFDAQRVAVVPFGGGPPVSGFDVPTAAFNWGTPKVVDAVRLGGFIWSLLNDGRLIHTTTAGALLSETVTGVLGPVALVGNPAGTRLAVVGASGGAVFSTDGTQLIARAGPRGVADSFSLSADATSVAVASGNVYDMPTRPLFDVGPDRLVERPVAVPDIEATFVEGKVLLANRPFGAGQIQLFDPATLALRASLENRSSWQGFTASPDGRWIVIGETGDVSVFDATTGKRYASYKSGDAAVPSVTVHPDGSRVLATFSNRAHVVLSMPDLAVLPAPDIDGDRVVAARWTEDGAWLLTVGESRRVSVRHPDTFALVSTLDGSYMPQSHGRAPMFSVGGGARIMAVVNDAPALWDARTGQPIGGPFPMRGGTSSAGADGHDLVVSALGEHVVLWDIALDGWPGRACRAVGRNFAPEEWQRFFGDEPYRATCSEWPPG